MLTLNQIPAFLVLLTALSTSSAGVVYTWVDDNGVTYFSDTPPTDESISVVLIEDLTPPATGMAMDEDYYSVVNQARRMETQRLLSEKLMAERLQAEAEANQARAGASDALQPTIVYDDWPGGYIYPYYPRHHYRHPHKDRKPGGPGKPEHYTRSSIIRPPPLSDALRLSPATR
jgi:hypothetical protein